jgi:hypothetical protein
MGKTAQSFRKEVGAEKRDFVDGNVLKLVNIS